MLQVQQGKVSLAKVSPGPESDLADLSQLGPKNIQAGLDPDPATPEKPQHKKYSLELSFKKVHPFKPARPSLAKTLNSEANEPDLRQHPPQGDCTSHPTLRASANSDSLACSDNPYDCYFGNTSGDVFQGQRKTVDTQLTKSILKKKTSPQISLESSLARRFSLKKSSIAENLSKLFPENRSKRVKFAPNMTIQLFET
jgi:hypothetical protein